MSTVVTDLQKQIDQLNADVMQKDSQIETLQAHHQAGNALSKELIDANVSLRANLILSNNRYQKQLNETNELQKVVNKYVPAKAA